ncbi:hypothetical protein OPV22_031638 [Ensete ventricosum]|uniref:Uncharacterized protein n=1 Tax=Ensete ventricosum TaxID=4639 RepID=A0AAV8PU79_ENSVE|nr:hypothetical protein OPV22_031638 [Ensete ventricosum]
MGIILWFAAGRYRDVVGMWTYVLKTTYFKCKHLDLDVMSQDYRFSYLTLGFYLPKDMFQESMVIMPAFGVQLEIHYWRTEMLDLSYCWIRIYLSLDTIYLGKEAMWSVWLGLKALRCRCFGDKVGTEDPVIFIAPTTIRVSPERIISMIHGLMDLLRSQLAGRREESTTPCLLLLDWIALF